MPFRGLFNNERAMDPSNLIFTPKSIQSKTLLPRVGATFTKAHNRDQPFFTVLKKPIINFYQGSTAKRGKTPTGVIGLQLQVNPRRYTANRANRKKTEIKVIQINQEEIKYEQMSPPFRSSAPSNLSPTKFVPKAPPKASYKEGVYYYYLGQGNNAELVEQLLLKRENWEPTTNTLYSLRWEQNRPKYHNSATKHTQLINHLPNHQQISDKGKLMMNLKKHCGQHSEQLFSIMPVCFELDFSKKSSCEQQLKKFAQFFWECSNKQDCSVSNDTEKESIKFKENQNSDLEIKNTISINNLNKTSNVKMIKSTVRNGRISRKEGSCQGEMSKKKDMKKAYKELVGKLKPFINYQDMSACRKESHSVTPFYKEVYGEMGLWLLKPSDLNRGRGIHLFKDLDELSGLLRNELKKNEKGSFILQKYIERPMLIDGRKFDIRVWVLVTHSKEVYIFQESYIRMSSQKYGLDSMNHFMHLTNNAVQKKANNYGQFEQGNILKTQILFEKKLIDESSLKQQVEKYVRISMQSTLDKMYVPNCKSQDITNTNSSLMSNPGGNHSSLVNNHKIKYFEIFGYDFMLDCEAHLWLIQINTNPCLELSNQWLQFIVPRMLDDAFRLTLDKVFPKSRAQITSLSGNNLASNICDTPLAQPPLIQNHYQHLSVINIQQSQSEQQALENLQRNRATINKINTSSEFHQSVYKSKMQTRKISIAHTSTSQFRNIQKNLWCLLEMQAVEQQLEVKIEDETQLIL